MRTTLDIDDDVLHDAKQLAQAQRKTAGKVISELARKTLNAPAEELNVRKLEIVDGFPLLPASGKVITVEEIERLMEQADLEDAGPVKRARSS